jgi:site-specific recombinase XerD
LYPFVVKVPSLCRRRNYQRTKKKKLKISANNRFTFSKFLEKAKEEIEIGEKVELAPHTLCRCFATRQAISGMPLPVLQKVLGHSKISTTALYIKDSDLSQYKEIKLLK